MEKRIYGGEWKMNKYVCLICDPEKGDSSSWIAPEIGFEDQPEDWICPVCGMCKEQFKKIWVVSNKSSPESRQTQKPVVSVKLNKKVRLNSIRVSNLYQSILARNWRAFRSGWSKKEWDGVIRPMGQFLRPNHNQKHLEFTQSFESMSLISW